MKQLLWILLFIEVFSSPQIVADCVSSLSNSTLIGLTNCNNSQYLMQCVIGTPPKPVSLQIYTNIQATILADTSLSTLGYDPSLSNTSVGLDVEGQISDAIQEWTVAGEEYQDLISVGTLTGLQIIDVANAILIGAPGWLINGEGLMQIGYSEGQATGILGYAFQNGQIITDIFSIVLRSIPQQSYILINGSSPIDNLIHIPLISDSSWQVQVVGFLGDNIDLTHLSQKYLILDSSISAMYINPALYKQINQKWFKACINNICPHNNFPNFTFILDGLSLTISSTNYMSSNQNGSYSLLFLSAENVQYFLLGIPFFQAFTITFIPSQASIAFSDGNINSIYVLGNGDMFQTSQITFLILILILFAFGSYLLWSIKSQRRRGFINDDHYSRIQRKSELSSVFIQIK